MQPSGFLPPWISALLTCMGGFCGCFKNSSPIMQVHDQGQNVKRSSPSEDFWSSSAFEMEDSGVQSQRSVSMIGISNQPLDPSGSTSHPSEFVNQGLLLWIQTRQQWLGNKRSEKRAHLQKPTINWNEVYESFLWINKPFPQPIPLPEMVDFLVDVWKQEDL
ncbi:uncharacterized protein LOC111285933 isoform X2 [Durio zibethinus]|uniref:Uncharacterized protein LOC111285933 isoform X2 n=1 Tax=Durio zibethinus TaxID=66656 RepID=A0A6P5XT08_DURZI|nr:uncharacterized protein LOC111285933 isoform X2 [Durio zibethinus]XP_022731375.1 uncharacterized protein LOC111285933 isoform X2 [Durio zibethinus]